MSWWTLCGWAGSRNYQGACITRFYIAQVDDSFHRVGDFTIAHRLVHTAIIEELDLLLVLYID